MAPMKKLSICENLSRRHSPTACLDDICSGGVIAITTKSSKCFFLLWNFTQEALKSPKSIKKLKLVLHLSASKYFPKNGNNGN